MLAFVENLVVKIYISGVLIDYLLKKYIPEYNLRANKLKVMKQLLNCMVFVQCKVKGNLRVFVHSLVSNMHPLSYPNLSFLLVTLGA